MSDYTKRIWIDGVRHNLRARTKAELNAQVATLKDQQRRRRLGLPDPERRRPDITYGALCDLLLDGYPYTEQSKTTLRYNLGYSRATFETAQAQNVTFESARAWFAKLDLAPTTKRHALTAMRQAFNFGIETGYCTENPAGKIAKPEATPSKHPFESWAEVFAVADAFGSPIFCAATVFVCSTGLRTQEWRPLQWRDIDFPDRSLIVSRTVQDGAITEASAKTSDSLRRVELTDQALAALSALPRPLQRDALIFPGPKGGLVNLQAWRRHEGNGRTNGAWTKALLTAGVEYRPPSQMRHTFATLALAAGTRIEWIAKQMGHSSTAITERHYRKWLRSDRRDLTLLNAALAAQTDHQSTIAGSGANS